MRAGFGSFSRAGCNVIDSRHPRHRRAIQGEHPIAVDREGPLLTLNLSPSYPMTTKTATRPRKSASKTSARKAPKTAAEKKPTAKKTAAKKTPAKKATAKKATAKKTTAKKATAKKAPAKKPAAKKAPAKKSVAQKTAAKKTTAKKTTAKKAAASIKSTTRSKAKPGTIKLRTTAVGTTRRGRSRKGTAAEAKLTAADRKRIEQERIDKIWKTFKRTGDENLRNILVEYHFPLVRYIAERLLQTLPKSIDLDDLVSAGTFGLLDAIRGFDLKRGIKFKTYCSTRIRGSILDELRSQDWVPRLVRLKAHRLDKAVSRLEAHHGREVNDYELAQDLELTMEELANLKVEASPKTMFSLSEKLDESDDDRDMEKVEIIEDKKGCDPVQSLHQQDVLEVITSNLTKKERLIVIMYYYEGLTMREIGDIMSLTESRVCQIHSNVMGRLKTQLDAISH